MKRSSLISHFLFVFLLLALSVSSGAQESAIRSPDQDWQEALSSAPTTVQVPEGNHFLILRSVIGVSKPLQQSEDFRALPEWTGSEKQLQDAFDQMRDERIYTQRSRPNLKRRSPWLYPKDGCYARAAHTARSFQSQGFPRPGKVFVFGNLTMKTPYDLRGAVYWSYHVAAAFRFNDQVMVLDPAVDFRRPLEMDEWVQRISRNPQRVRVSICESFAYSPGSACRGGGPRQESASVNHLMNFLPLEWNQLLRLKMNPEKLTGDEPPWKQ